MNKEEANDLIALHYPRYINKTVFFEEAGVTAIVRAIEALEGPDGVFTATVYLDDPNETDSAFEKHLFSHLPLEDLITRARII